MKRLSELAIALRSKVVDITAEPLLRDRLLEMGLAPGGLVERLRSLPFGGPIVVQAGSLTMALRKDEADQVWVEEA